MKEIKKIVVVGIGYIGLPTSILLAEAGFEVVGMDVNPATVESLHNGKIHIIEPGLQQELEKALRGGNLRYSSKTEPADAFYICVPTPIKVKDGEPHSDVSFVMSAAESIAPVLRRGNLVILESTVPPRTTEKMSALLSEKSGIPEGEFYAVHCPERVLPGQMLRELRTNDRIIGSRTPEGLALARSIYEKLLHGGTIRETDDITAETCKLVENSYRDVNIAFANELSILCDRLGIDVQGLINLANCHPRVNIHRPGVGVGGHCIAVDPWFLYEQYPQGARMIGTARAVNDGKPFWVADKVEGILGRDRSRTIGVLGLAYKPDVDDLRESPSVKLGQELQKRGYRVLACEPNVPVGEVKGLDNRTLDDVLGGADFLVVTLAHRQFRERADEIEAKPHYDCVGLLPV